MTLLISFVFAFVISAITTGLIRSVAVKYDVLDRPINERKKHLSAVPLLGGLALFISLVLAIVFFDMIGWLPGIHIKAKYLVGIVVAAGLLAFGGALDDRFDLKPTRQFIWPLLAVLAVILSGIGVAYITNPFGGLLDLDNIVFTAIHIDGVPYHLTVLSDIFTLAWLLMLTYTTKFMDGLDGLVAGVTVIGAMVIAGVSLMQEVAQPDTALLALIVAGVFGGFLLYNYHPARIFLGEGGSTMAGFLLGVLAIISGGKIATTLLILGLPLFDAIIVIIRRLIKKQSPFGGDRSHLHFLLVDNGMPQRQVAMLYWFLAAFFGVSTLILRGPQKVIAIGLIISILFIGLATILIIKKSHHNPQKND